MPSDNEVNVNTLAASMALIMPSADANDIAEFAPALLDAMSNYSINTPLRQTAFLAQGAEESNELWHLRAKYKTERGEEYASGAAYEGRDDLGNTEPGDGKLFKGRGFLQTTGRANYQKLSDALGVDFVSQPQLLNEPKWSAFSAAHYFSSHGCNELADDGDFVTITKRINGGTNGLQARLTYLASAQTAFGIEAA